MTATDWATDAIELLQQNATRNGLGLNTEVRDWRHLWPAQFDLVLAADVLYEFRNVEPLLVRLRELAPVSLLALAGRPYESTFLQQWSGGVEEIAERVVRLRPAPG